MKKECPSEQSLSAFLDGALADACRHQIREHLDNCAVCRQALKRFELGDEAIRSLPGITARPAFNREFWHKIDQMGMVRRQSFWGMRWLAHWKPLLAAGLTASIIAGVAIWQFTSPVPSVQDVIIAESIEMLNDFDLIQNLELFETWEALQMINAQG